MIERVRESVLFKALLKRRLIGAAFIASLLSIFYWGMIASDRFVSEAQIIIQGTDMGAMQSVDVASLLSGSSGGRDQLLLRAHMLSTDMLLKLDDKLDLRKHYSDSEHDLLSRMWGRDTPMEWFHNYYLSRIHIDLDTEGDVLVIKAEAYNPEMAHAIAELMVEEGEAYMNEIAHKLASEQVSFLEKQVEKLGMRNIHARKAVLAYQNEHGQVSPQNTVENLSGIINNLEASLAELKSKRTALLGYLMPGSASVAEIDMQIAAVKKQIRLENLKLTSPTGSTLNMTLEQFQRLQLEAEFAQQLYTTALESLERGRIESLRTIKSVSVLQSPTQPQYPLEPRRIYNIIVFILVALLIAGILHLLAAIVQDHKD